MKSMVSGISIVCMGGYEPKYNWGEPYDLTTIRHSNGGRLVDFIVTSDQWFIQDEFFLHNFWYQWFSYQWFDYQWFTQDELIIDYQLFSYLQYLKMQPQKKPSLQALRVMDSQGGQAPKPDSRGCPESPCWMYNIV